MKGAIIYDEPRVMYLRASTGFCFSIKAIGETSQSWLDGPTWSVSRYSKKWNSVITEDEYKQRHCSLCVPPAILKQIDDLIGYVEPEEKA